MSVIEIKNDEEFEDQVASLNGPCVLDFYTDWCPPCKMLAPVFEQVSNEVEDVKFFKINAESAAETAQSFGVMSVPTLVAFHGKTLETVSGSVQKSKVEELAQIALDASKEE